jgi:hypothetical protein
MRQLAAISVANPDIQLTAVFMPKEPDQPERHLVVFRTYSQGGMIYGCSECLWQYRPASLAEASGEARLTTAEALFEVNDCAEFRPNKHDVA